MGNICNRSNKSGPKYRIVVPNHSVEDNIHSKNHPNKNYASNRIKTTKYSIITFLPKNLFEQFHRFANLYFLFVVALNWVPQVQAFGKEIAMLPIVFVLTVTAVKDAFEDFRRYKSDKKVNGSKCRVYSQSNQQFHPQDWFDVHVGDIIHLSCNDIIPADILLLKSSDELDICHVETMNLDGETNLKQRQAVTGINYQNNEYEASRFTYKVECEQPNAEIYKFNGYVKLSDAEGDIVPLNQNNVMLRGCIMRNTDWIEGIVVYAGHETKSMMNNRNPRYKRSKLERALNRDVIWCVIILLFLCFFCAAGSALWLGQFEDSTKISFIAFESSEQFNPYFQAFIVFFTYIIIFQSVIPLPLYVSLEIIKLCQVYFINADLHLYYEPTDKRVECRALNITEDLGQVEYIFSDKTGTLTENQMEFKSCTIAGRNYPHAPDFDDDLQSETGSRYSLANISRNSSVMENLKIETEIQRELSSMCLRSLGSVDISIQTVNHKNLIQEFFLLMAICNTVVVSLHPHEDIMDAEGNVEDNEPHPPPVPPVLKNGKKSHHNSYENPVLQERYTKLADAPPVVKKLAPLNGAASGTPKTNYPLPPIHAQLLDREKFPNYTERLKYMPKISTPTGSVTGSFAESSIRSDMSRTRYEAESPDELALVRAASTYNCCLKGRSAKAVTVWLPAEGEVEFEILHVLSFDSTRKRMSVVVKHPMTKEIILYTKGADSAVLSVLAKKYSEDDEFMKMRRRTEEYILAYAMEGLRTLCMAKKTITKGEYEKWAAEHLEAESALEDREEKLLQSACKIECNLDLLGATGIEDKLQEGVPETIANLRTAGIKVWVLTGDKQETAIQVAYSSKLFNPEQELILVNAESKEATHDIMKHHIEEISREEQTPRETPSSPPTKIKQYGLVIDGKTLAFALDESLQKIFLYLAGKCNSVICCRSSPIQKGLVVKLARDELEVLTLAIGDGANDVSMIQMADVGIGISGQEGMQAVMASDFAIARFSFLERMLLVHGHWCYSRIARFSAFMFYKSLISTMVLFWFNLYSGYSGATHIDSLFLMCHHVIFTAFPPIVNGIIDKDLSPETLLQFPPLYKVGSESQTYTRLSFLIVFLDSVYQSVCIHFVCYFGYFDGVGMWEYGSTMMVSLVLAILFHSAIETYRWMWPQWLTLILSFLAFYLFGIFIDSFFFTFDHPVTPYWVMQNTISKPIHAVIVLVSVVTSLLPRIIVRSLQMTVRPDVIMTAQQAEKDAEEAMSDSRTTSPDSGYNRRDSRDMEDDKSRDMAYDNKGYDVKHDNSKNGDGNHSNGNTDSQSGTQLTASENGHGQRNGRILRQRQLSNTSTDARVAETAT